MKPQLNEHEIRLRQLSESTIKRFLEGQTGRRIRQLTVYKEEPLGDNRFPTLRCPDLTIIYLADTYRLAFIQVKTFCHNIQRSREELDIKVRELAAELQDTNRIEYFLAQKNYPHDVIESILSKGIEIYGARTTINSGLVWVLDLGENERLPQILQTP